MQDVKVVEVFTVDPNDVDMVHMLPFVPLVTLGKQSFCINRYNARQPILGFVFLSKYVAEDQDHIVEAPPSLWFANQVSTNVFCAVPLSRLRADLSQTMANGCATLALLNILLNKPSVQLGASLTEFKAGTAPLAPFLRGFLLDSNTSLREVHNAHARRLEHLNSDLLVSNEYEDANGWIDSEDDEAAQKKKEAQEKKRAAASKKRARKPSASTASKKKRLTGDDTCHYKAFVFAESQVWVLDGLSEKPISLGPADEHNWVYLALSAIQAKMLDAGDMVNVLAVCQSPTVALRAELLTNIRTLFSLRDALHGAARPAKKPGRLYLDENDDLDDAALSKYGTTRAALDAVRPDEDILANMGDDEASKIALVATLETEQARIQGEYMEEMRDVAREEERCDGRKRDYGQLMHRWVKKIAERGDLQGLVG